MKPAGALAALPLAVGLLAACSGSEQPGPAPSASASVAASASAAAMASAVAMASPGPQRAAVSGETGRVGGLTGRVSALNADVSGLNTRVTEQGLVIDLPADVLFDFDQATLTPAAEGALGKAADVIRRSPAGAIRVVGHTDAKGNDAYNQRLSEARARAVADWFGGQVGVRTRPFEVSGRGEAEPVAANARPDGSDDPAGRARNRRVEVVVPTA